MSDQRPWPGDVTPIEASFARVGCKGAGLRDFVHPLLVTLADVAHFDATYFVTGSNGDEAVVDAYSPTGAGQVDPLPSSLAGAFPLAGGVSVLVLDTRSRVLGALGGTGRSRGDLDEAVIAMMESFAHLIADHLAHRNDDRQPTWPVANLVAVGVVVGDLTGAASFANRAWTAMTGQQEADWRGQGWLSGLDLFHREADRTALLESVRRGESHDTDWQITDSTGRPRVFHVTALPDISSSGPRGFVATVVDVTDDRARTTSLHHQATHDPLTGLYNRTQFLEFVGHALDRQRREPRRPATVLFIDIDGLKAINDRLGHDAGDRLMRTAAARISGAVRSADVVARYGGDEFTVLCEDLSPASEASTIASRIREAALTTTDGDAISLSLSIGFAIADDADLDPAQIVCEADQAMYRARGEASARREVVRS